MIESPSCGVCFNAFTKKKKNIVYWKKKGCSFVLSCMWCYRERSLSNISVCRYFDVEAVLWAMGATALVSFGMSLFALQSKVRSDPLSHCQKGNFINRSDSSACGEYLVGVSFQRCWEHLNAKPLARFPHATPAVGFKTDWIAVDAQYDYCWIQCLCQSN